MWAVVSSQQIEKNENRMMCGDKKSEKILSSRWYLYPQHSVH